MLSVPDPVWIQTHFPEGVRGVMRFTLVWRGQLPASANSGKTKEIAKIRAELSEQFKYLWQTHNSLQVLKEQGFIRNPSSTNQFYDQSATPRMMWERRPQDMINLIDWLPVGQHKYLPLVRKSLDLSCELNILFLRQDDPGALISQGGDLDNRIKALLDALRMPSDQEQDKAPPSEDLYCLMQSDTLISSLDIETERLLLPETKHPQEVHLVIGVSLRILRVHAGNYCLL